MAKKVVSTVPKEEVSPLVQFAIQSNKNLVKNGQIPDPAEVEKLAAAPLIHEQSVEDYYPNLPVDYYDKYEDYINPYTLKGRSLSLEEMNQKRFENQTLGQELGHAVGRIATNIVPQIISGYASMLDLPGYFDAEHAANNSIVNWAIDAKKHVDEEMFPIYTDPSNPNMDLTSSAWWASRGSGLVESIGSFLAQGAGIGKGISLLGEVVGAAVKGKALFSALEAIPGVTNGAKLATATGRRLQTLTTATMLNQSEAVIEATQVYRDTYNNAIKANLDEKTARENAANAASTTMNLNRINILLNLTSASAFLKPVKGVGRNLLKAETLGGGIKEVLKEGGQEAIEELVNHVASKKGMAVGERKNYGFADALKDMGSMEGLEAAFLGAIGGMVQTGGTHLLQGFKYGPGATTDENGNKISARQAHREDYEKQQAIIEDLKSKGVKVNESMMNIKDTLLFQEKLQNAKTPEEAKELQDQLFETQVLKHAQAGTLDVLENFYKAETERPVEEVGEEYVNNAKEAIKNLKNLERIYNNFEGYENRDDLFFNRASDIRIEKQLRQYKLDQQQASVSLGEKVNDIAKKYKFQTEREVLIKKEGKVVNTEKKSDEIPMPFSMMNLEENTGDTTENKAVYDKFLAEVQRLPEYKTSKQLNNVVDAVSKLQEDNNKEFEELTSEKHQVKVAEENRKKAIVKELTEKLKKATTKSEIEKLKASTEDKEFHKMADEKLEKADLDNKAAAANKAKDLKQQQIAEKIKNVTLETVEDIRKEIDDAELSQERKNQLHDILDKKNAELQGEEVETTEDPLSMFTQGKVDEEVVNSNAKSNATNVPTDFPDINTEEKTVEEEVEESTQKLLEQDGVVIGEDGEGNLIYSYTRTADGSDKGAFLSREFNQKESFGVVDREEFTDKLTDNKEVLDPDFLLPGTPLEIEVDNDYSGEKYDPTSTERETVEWQLRLIELQKLAKEQGKLITQLDEYINEVPLKVTTKDNKIVFYIHDNAWYRAENIDNTPEAIAQQKALNHEMRKKVIAKKQKTKVTHKGFGKLFKSANNEQKAVSDAMPDPNLVLGVGKDKNGVMQTELSNDVETLLGEGATILPTNIQNGRPYAIVKVGPNTFLPIPLQRATLSTKVVDSIMFAIEAHLTGDENNPIVQAINKSTQLDITTTQGLADYLNQFIYLYRTEGSQGLEPVLAELNTKLKSNNFLLAVTANTIEFGRPQTQMGSYIDKNGNKVTKYRVELSQNYKPRQKDLNTLRENLKDMLSNMSLKDLKADNNTVLILDKDGNTETTKYKEFVKTTHTTNLLSVNIGTEEQPKWVYTIQPNITFDTSFAQTKKNKATTTATTVPTTTPIITPTANTGLSSINDPLYLRGLELSNLIKTLEKDTDIFEKLDIPFEYKSNLKSSDFIKILQKNLGGVNIDLKSDLFKDTFKKSLEEFTKNSSVKIVFFGLDQLQVVTNNYQYVVKGQDLADTLKKAIDFINKANLIEALEKRGFLYGDNHIEIFYDEKSLSEAINKKEESYQKRLTYSKNVFTINHIERSIKEYFKNPKFEKELRLKNKTWGDVLEVLDIKNARDLYKKIGGYESKINDVYEYIVKQTNKIKDLKKQDDAELSDTQPITDAKAEIEKRRQEALVFERKMNSAGTELLFVSKSKDFSLGWFTEEEAKKEINAKYDAELAALEQQLEANKSTVEEEVETATEEMLIKDAVTGFKSVEQINSLIESLRDGSLTPEMLEVENTTREQAIVFFNKVKAQFEENLKNSKTITLSNGLTISSNANEQDASDSDDSVFEDELPETLTEEQVDELKPEIESMVVRGIGPSTQSSLISYIATDILKQTLASKETNRKQKVNVKPIMAKHKKSFEQLAKFFDDNGFPGKAKQCRAIVEQFDKVNKLVNEYMSVLIAGKVNEEVNLDDSEEVVGLQKLVYNDDWVFTVNSLTTASVDLRKFLAGIQLITEDGPVNTILEFPEILPIDVVFNTLHEVLANKPADFDTMMKVLELYTEKFPWFKTVIEELENGSEKVQNEFVSEMTKHSINMEFLMWSKDKNENYVLRKWSSNSSSVEQRLKNLWESNLKGRGTKSNLVEVSDEGEYVINKAEADRLISIANSWASSSDDVIENIPFDDIANWLGNLGIVITDKTYKDLKDGMFNNGGKLVWKALFRNDKGLIKVLAKSLQKAVDQKLTMEEADLLNDSVVKALAKLDARNNLNTFSNSFQAGGKTVYSYGNNNYLVNRMRDLTMYDSTTGKFVNEDLINKLNNISFTKDSIWLKELQSDKEIGEITRNSLGVSYLSLEALKKLFTQSQDNRKLNNLTSAEHEVIKIGFFQTGQGSIINNDERRLVSFFYPTMSDKSTMLSIRALSQQFKLEEGEISQKNLKLLYEALVTPEINRIRDKQANNIKGYNPNAFYFLPELNNLMIQLEENAEGNPIEKSFLDIVIDGDDVLFQEDVQTQVFDAIKTTFDKLVEDKLTDWDKLGIGKTILNSKGKKTDEYTFLDKTYMANVAKGLKGKPKVKYAAADYVYNYLIANSEAFKLFASDPALYAKFKSESAYAKELNKTVEELTQEDKQVLMKQNLEETFINIGKRLAGDIAPGLELANSKDNNYVQVFLQDKELSSKNLKDKYQKEYFSKIINIYADKKKGYGAMEGSDAQEYTTWKEHLYVLKQLGRLTSEQYNIINRKLTAQSEGKINDNTKLSYDEVEIVLQPIKPVYVGNISSVEDNVDRRVYIKSSSFPLIPEFTVGLQLEKVRKGLEKYETTKASSVNKDGSPIFVRASFGTANKVGAVKNAVAVFDDNGDVVDNFEVTDDNTLLLSRANFRIQQDVPYDREKDSINVGTQERKLLFVNLLDVEIEPGVSGQNLLDVYNQTYKELFEYAQESLSKKLGLKATITTTIGTESLMSKPTTNIFDTVETKTAEKGKLSAVKKTLLDSELTEELKEYGEDTYNRVNYINKNFDNIVEQLLNMENSIFTDKENYKKDC